MQFGYSRDYAVKQLRPISNQCIAIGVIMSFSASKFKITAAAALAAGAVFSAAPALAGPDVVPFGRSVTISAANGTDATAYTVNNLQPSGHNDGVFFSDVAVTSVKGTAGPIVGDFNARAADGTTYTAILGSNPEGLTNQPLQPGGSAHGKVFFQVNNGPAPDSVVYSIGRNDDRAIWKG